MKLCMCGATNYTTMCDKCLQPLCRKCSTIVLPKMVNGEIEIKHVRCMSKKFQTEYLGVVK